jgi:hypothetical protein
MLTKILKICRIKLKQKTFTMNNFDKFSVWVEVNHPQLFELLFKKVASMAEYRFKKGSGLLIRVFESHIDTKEKFTKNKICDLINSGFFRPIKEMEDRFEMYDKLLTSSVIYKTLVYKFLKLSNFI